MSQVQGCRFLQLESSKVIIEVDAMFKAQTRTDPRSQAAFRKMQITTSDDQVAMSWSASLTLLVQLLRIISLPIVFRMHFDGLKCNKLDRIYLLSAFFRQLGSKYRI